MTSPSLTTDASICSVILTFNQKTDLVACLKAIAAQSHAVDAILVVDNASIDGTDVFLVEHGFLPYPASDTTQTHEIHGEIAGIPIRYIRCVENSGAAGGYAFAFNEAYQHGYEWLWVSDADGEADSNCLEALLQHGAEGDFIAPLLLDRDHPEQLCFTLRTDMHTMFSKNVKRIEDVYRVSDNGIIRHTANPWSSSLINRRFITVAGLPKIEYFLAGEDYEYVLRGLRKKLRVLTVTSARCFHPHQNKKVNQLLMYYRYRNYFDLIGRHYGPGILALHLLKNMTEQIRKWHVDELKLMANAWWAAAHQDYVISPQMMAQLRPASTTPPATEQRSL